MKAAAFHTPIALLVFNRPEETRRVFERIAELRPAKLLLVADGPRAGRPGEAERCAQVREIVSRVDWECEVLRDFSETNLGCRRRVSSGLDWVFEQCEEAIIVEDDCLPDPSFFPYCAELLERYRDDPRVMMVSGDKFVPDAVREGSYYFSRYPHIWGWATWRRAWRSYDVDMTAWRELRSTDWLLGVLGGNRAARDYWQRCFDSTCDGGLDTWDYQWVLACWRSGGLSAMPARNLVSNIGFNQDATHTHVVNGWSDLPAEPLRFPLRHPAAVVRDAKLDRRTDEVVFGTPAGGVGAGLGKVIRRVLRAPRAFFHQGPRASAAPSSRGAQG